MTKYQKYISQELHHFVGGPILRVNAEDDKQLEACYKRLIQIIKSGSLLANATRENFSVKVRINPKKKLYNNEKFDCDAVCFCDIPADDLYIHTKKYGRFGLSFSKEFLINQGVRPVYYLPKNFRMPLDRTNTLIKKKPKELTGGSFFERRTDYLLRLLGYLKRNPTCLPDDLNNHADLTRCENFLITHFYGHLKVFDPGLGDEHVDNYYLEREWRVLGKVFFTLEDIKMIFIPEEFAKRLRKNIGEYCGQLLFL